MSKTICAFINHNSKMIKRPSFGVKTVITVTCSIMERIYVVFSSQCKPRLKKFHIFYCSKPSNGN